eukprot:5921633-Pyramimonas_sp.AAC.1
MREWPERCARFPQLQHHHHEEYPERGGVKWAPVATAEGERVQVIHPRVHPVAFAIARGWAPGGGELGGRANGGAPA